jgi:hypothetical protein
VLRLLFSDGTVGDPDFSAGQWAGVLEPPNDAASFAQVTVDAEAGTIDRLARRSPPGAVPLP